MYKLGKQQEFNLKYLGTRGTYEGGNTAYYGVVLSFEDEHGTLIKWYTTDKGQLEYRVREKPYQVKATISHILYRDDQTIQRVEVQRVKEINSKES